MKRPILILVGLALILGRVEGDAIARIPVAHSWGDIFAASPITIDSAGAIFPDGAAAFSRPAQVGVWVGIDRDSASSDGAVVLYCVSKGVAFATSPDDGLGPFTVVVHAPKNVAQLADLVKPLQAQRKVPRFNDSTFVLCAHTVALSGSGEYRIELVQRSKSDPKAPANVLAQVTVEVSGDVAPAWVPWGEPTAAAALPTLAEHWDQGGVSAAVSNPSGGAAVPKTPLEPFYYAQTPDNTSPLPQLIPDQTDPQSELKVVGHTLVYAGKDIRWVFTQDYFLTRWWVNDQPFVLPPEPKNAARCRDFSGQIPAGDPTRVMFQLDFQAERLGVTKGDKVSVQLLNCPSGYQSQPYAQLKMLDVAQADAGTPTASFSFLSNRVDFIYSGDPKNPVGQ